VGLLRQSHLPAQRFYATVAFEKRELGAVQRKAHSHRAHAYHLLQLVNRAVFVSESGKRERSLKWTAALRVSAGTKVAVSVELASTSRISQSYVVKTSLSPE